MKLPGEVNILGICHSIKYVANPAEVDLERRTSLWGQIDYWSRSIRIYQNERPQEDVWGTVLHEVIHGIVTELHLKWLDKDENHDEMERLSLALTDVLIRNGWLKVDADAKERET